MIVVSTAKTEIGEPCLESVRAEKPDRHLTATGPMAALANVTGMIQNLPPEAIVCWVDGDDWILPGALSRVAREYDRPDVWATWGSYQTADGRRGIANAYAPGEDIRRSEWRASHLKTFRAGLFRAIPCGELRHSLEWLTRAIDLAVMFPAIELAGLDRCRFVSDVIYVYNWHASFERNATEPEKRHERTVAEWIRKRPPLKRLESAPWL